MRKTTFKNTAKPKEPLGTSDGDYAFDEVCPLMGMWGGYLQAIVSLVGSRHFSGSYPADSRFGIYKCEGGCRIEGRGDLVLSERGCYWDHGGYKASEKAEQAWMAGLITHIVLKWDPMDPVESMAIAAAEYAEFPVEELIGILKSSKIGQNPFGGDPLRYFFLGSGGWKTKEIDRDYQRWCFKNFNEVDDEWVDRHFAAKDKGEEYYKALCKAISDRFGYSYSIFCCSGSLDDKGAPHYWINGSGHLFGWFTDEGVQKVIEDLKTLDQAALSTKYFDRK